MTICKEYTVSAARVMTNVKNTEYTVSASRVMTNVKNTEYNVSAARVMTNVSQTDQRSLRQPDEIKICIRLQQI